MMIKYWIAKLLAPWKNGMEQHPSTMKDYQIAQNKVRVDFTTTLVLNEVQIRALDALVGYGDDAFIKVFYERLGQAYMRDHEAGLRSFFATVRTEALPALGRIDTLRTGMLEALKKS